MVDDIRIMTDEQLEKEIAEYSWAEKAVEGTSLQCPAGYHDNMAYCRLLSLRDEQRGRKRRGGVR